MRQARQARPANEPPMRALVEAIRETWAGLDAESVTALRVRLRVVAAASGLSGAIERNSEATITALIGASVLLLRDQVTRCGLGAAAA
ncbi:MAG: hypothetical protein LBG11_04685 [Bifidobacteriaceae bacterium]|nr:hypothetical protein [Bifidobacteriaceae bacterium]